MRIQIDANFVILDTNERGEQTKTETWSYEKGCTFVWTVCCYNKRDFAVSMHDKNTDGLYMQ